MRNFFVFVLLAVTIISSPSGSVIRCNASEERSGDDGVSIRLVGLPSSGEDLRMGLIAEGDKPICGMQAIVSWDPDAVESVEVLADPILAERGGVVSFAYREDGIAIVVDACENFTANEIAEISIGTSAAFSGRSVCFEISVLSLCFWSEDRLLSAELPEKEKLWITLPSPDAHNGAFCATVDTEEGSDTVALTMSAIADVGCFAAGFEVYAVELDGFESQCFSVLRVLGGDGSVKRAFSHTAILSSKKRYCVIIKPVAYFGNEVASGRETVILIDNGEVRR